MDIEAHVNTVEERLRAAAAAGDETTRRVASALATALEPALRLAVLDAASELAEEVSDALGNEVVELRLEPGRVLVSVARTAAEPDAAGDEHDGAVPSRITLRLPETLKAKAEHAAAAERVSLNTWLTRAVEHALRRTAPPASQRGSARLRGWVQA
jgi:predicted HicB family RNase H-like nuclease